jgi:hypothetical protein
VELVRAAAQRGLLVDGSGGLELRAGAELALPDDLHDLWRARTAHLVARHGRRLQGTLELAAVLGPTIAPDVWKAACVRALATPPSGVLPQLIEERVLRPVQGGLVFAHALWQRSLLREAEQGGRLAELNLHIAESLAGTVGLRARGRRGMHLLAAGAASAALHPLREGLEEAIAAGDLPEIEVLCEGWDAAFSSSGVPENGPEAITGMVAVAAGTALRRDLRRAATWAQRVEPLARETGDHRALLRALTVLVQCGRDTIAEVEPIAAEALSMARALGDAKTERSVIHSLAIARRAAGQAESAEVLLRASIGLGNRTALHDLAVLLRRRGELCQAEEIADEAVAWARRGDRAQLGPSLHLLGTLRAARGDPPGAEALFEEAAIQLDAYGRLDSVVALLSLAESRLSRGAIAEILPLLPDLARRAARIGQPTVLAGVATYELACVVTQEDPGGFLAAAARLEARLAALPGPATEVAAGLEGAAELADAAGYPDRAARVRELSRSTY